MSAAPYPNAILTDICEQLLDAGLAQEQIANLAKDIPGECEGANLKRQEVPGKMEYYDGQLRPVVDASRDGWWRFNKHYDRNGYCDNPGRGY